MTRQEHLLQILSEECNETAHRISKALRFTLDEVQPGQDLTNEERIIYEFNDIVAVMEILQEEKIIKIVFDRNAVELKKAKVKEWLAYSDKVGTVEKGK